MPKGAAPSARVGGVNDDVVEVGGHGSRLFVLVADGLEDLVHGLHRIRHDVEVAADAPGAGGDEHDMIDADLGELGAALRELAGRLARAETAADRGLDLVGVAADRFACSGEDVEFVAQGGAAVRTSIRRLSASEARYALTSGPSS